MLRATDIRDLARGFGEKAAGLGLEFVGTFASNKSLRDRGRKLERTGDKRVRAAEEEAKAAAEKDETRAKDSKRPAPGNGRTPTAVHEKEAAGVKGSRTSERQ